MFNISEQDKKQFISGLMIAIAIGVGVGIVARIVFAPAQQSQPFNVECIRYCEHSTSLGYCIQECHKQNETFINKKPSPSIIGNDTFIKPLE